MAQPTAYNPATDFSAEEANAVGGRSTVRTAALDAEFAAINATLDEVLAVISLNQRDDGNIRDGRVKLHTLAADVRALLALGGITAANLRGDWVTATAYVPLDLVSQSGNTYICTTAHTSGTFATDLAADKWLIVTLGTAVAASAVGFAPFGTIAATNVQAAVEEVDTEVRAIATAAAVASQLADATTAARGDALVGWGAIVSIVDGVLTRHASLAAAVSAISTTRCTVIVRDDVTMAASATFPATATLRVENGAQITTTGYTLTVNGRFIAPEERQCFSGSGTVKFGKGAVDAVRPQWWGAVGDGVIADGSGTDCTTAFQRAIAASCEDGVSDVGIHPIKTGAGYFVFGALSLPPAVRMYGEGRHMTHFIAKTGTTGVWLGDAGNAAKIVLEGFAMYGRSLSGITYGIQLGQTIDHGTEGHLRDLFVRDVDGASAVWGIDVTGNVGYYDWLTTYDCTSGIKITGTANMASKLAPYVCTTTGLEINGTDVHGVEIEAPGNSCVPLKISGSASVNGCTVSLANSTTISHLVELGGSATTWEVRNFRVVFGNTPSGITVSNGNFKRSDGTYFGGNATAGSQDGEGHYSSEHNGGKYTSFVLRVINTAGTLQHRICGPDGTASNFASAINGATATLTNTPTGTDSSTAMAAGGKISSASTSIFVLDTKAQRAGDCSFVLGEVQTSTGDNIRAIAYAFSININGTTRTRLVIQFVDAVLGTGYALNTTNLASGEYVQASFNGWVTH